jgi:hypothetical protein
MFENLCLEQLGARHSIFNFSPIFSKNCALQSKNDRKIGDTLPPLTEGGVVFAADQYLEAWLGLGMIGTLEFRAVDI